MTGKCIFCGEPTATMGSFFPDWDAMGFLHYFWHCGRHEYTAENLHRVSAAVHDQHRAGVETDLLLISRDETEIGFPEEQENEE